MLERLEVAYVRPATHQADKRKQPKAHFSCAVFSDSTPEWTVHFWEGTGLLMWAPETVLFAGRMGVKGIKLKDELHICFLPLHHFVQVFWSLKKAFPALFPLSNVYWYIDSAFSPPCALPGPGPEPGTPKGLYPHPGVYKSVQEWHCSSTPGRKTAGSFLQQLMQCKEQAPQLWPVHDFPVNSTQHFMDFAHL